MGLSTLLGFGASAGTILLFADNIDALAVIRAFAGFVLSATLLGCVFLAFAYCISAWVSEKSKAAGGALLFWFTFVLIFDLALLGTLVATEGRFHPEVFPFLLL